MLFTHYHDMSRYWVTWYHDMSRFSVTCHDFQWLVTIFSDLSRFSVTCHDFQWLVTIFSDISQYWHISLIRFIIIHVILFFMVIYHLIICYFIDMSLFLVTGVWMIFHFYDMSFMMTCQIVVTCPKQVTWHVISKVNMTYHMTLTWHVPHVIWQSFSLVTCHMTVIWQSYDMSYDMSPVVVSPGLPSLRF